MTYQALARKWRPKTFAELAGQEHVVTALTNALTRGQLHHAYLLTGTRGVGKTTIARILAKSLNCITNGVTATPCGTCAACVDIDAGRFVDLLELDAASNTGIDNMREILDNARYAPTVGRYKVYLIDEVHMLSKAAFNSMLKTLEEPPEHVKFVLATTDPQKIPVTVLSRCLQFNLTPLPPSLIIDRLAAILGAEGMAFDAGALTLIAKAAHGSMRDALSLLDQAIAYGGGDVREAPVRAMLGAVDRDYAYRIADALTAGDGPALIAEADALAARGAAFAPALEELASLFHRIAVAQTVPQAIATMDDGARISALAASMAPENVQLAYQICIQGRADLALAPDEATGFSMTLLRLLAFEPGRGSAPDAVSPVRAAAPAPGHRRRAPCRRARPVRRQAWQRSQPRLPKRVRPSRCPPTLRSGPRSLLRSSCRRSRRNWLRKPSSSRWRAMFSRSRCPRRTSISRTGRTRTSSSSRSTRRRAANGCWRSRSARSRKARSPRRKSARVPNSRRNPKPRFATSRSCATCSSASTPKFAPTRSNRSREEHAAMMKNQLAGLMKQAQQMQDNLKKAQDELAQMEVEGQSGAGLVKVVMTCKHDVKRVTIDPSLIGEDKDMLEDLVAAAVNDAVRRVETATQEKMAGLTMGMPMPPGFKLPF